MPCTSRNNQRLPNVEFSLPSTSDTVGSILDILAEVVRVLAESSFQSPSTNPLKLS